MSSYWIWHYGEYEIFHNMKTNLRREERGLHRPPFWKVSVPYATVKFRREFECDGGYLKCFINGDGYISVNRKFYKSETVIKLNPGKISVAISVSNPNGLPAIYVESDVCPSDEKWDSDYFVGDFQAVGMNKYFDSPDKNPEIFPFEYERKFPESQEKIGDGILFDFGTEIFGYLNIADAELTDEMKIFYGESREEALDTDYSYITDEVCGSSNYRLKQRAFRYIYVVNSGSDINLTADYEFLPLEYKGKFECSNKLFNDIYKVAEYTFHLNCRETYLDGIKRDRWTWSGDAYQSSRINAYLFADKEIDQRTIIGLAGKLPIEQHINTIVDYSLLWIIGLREHYMTYGDKAFLGRIYPMAKKLIEFCETRKNKDGFIEGKDGDWTFIDWAKIDKTNAISAEQMLFIAAYRSMHEISKALGYESDLYFEEAEKLTQKVNKYYFCVEKGAYIDSYTSGKNNVTRHANIFAIMYDIATEEQKQSILNNVLNNDDVPAITTPYFKGYELDVLGKMGQYFAIEKQIDSYYGGIVNLGAKTIWEEYDPEMVGIQHYAMYGGKYEKSLCHAWGAGAIYIFGRYYIGVYPTSSGYETFNVEPSLGGLESFEGTAPINGGEITVKLDADRLEVISTKDGGTLIWKGKRYILKADEKMVITY